jgi:hypothetical protein
MFATIVSKPIIFVFLALKEFLKLVSFTNDGLTNWKAFVALGVAEVSFLAALVFGIVILRGRFEDLPFDIPPKLAMVIGVCALFVPSYHLIYRSKLRKSCDTSFNRLSPDAKLLLGGVAAIGVLALTQLALFAAVTSHKFR